MAYPPPPWTLHRAVCAEGLPAASSCISLQADTDVPCRACAHLCRRADEPATSLMTLPRCSAQAAAGIGCRTELLCLAAALRVLQHLGVREPCATCVGVC